MVIDTAVGDVLILSTDRVSHIYSVGRVTRRGQQPFVESRQPDVCERPRDGVRLGEGHGGAWPTNFHSRLR